MVLQTPNVGLYCVVALSGGEAFVAFREKSNNEIKLTKLGKDGRKTGRIYKCETKRKSYVTGLLYSDPYVFIIQEDGNVTKINGNTLTRCEYTKKVPARGLYPGELIKINQESDELLLTDYGKGEVFIYNTKTEYKDIKIRGLEGPVKAVRDCNLCEVLYIVTEYDGCSVKLYSEEWSLLEKICGREADSQLQLSRPLSAVMITNQNLLIADRNNNRVVEVTWEGKFVKELLSTNDVCFPMAMSYQEGRLWIVAMKNGLKDVTAYTIFD